MMGADKWTEGPWVVDGPPWNQIVWSSPENRVCFLAHSNRLDDERDIATGRLIAAAPDLAEAIKPLAFSNPDIPPPGVNAEDWRAAVDAARVALSKARTA